MSNYDSSSQQYQPEGAPPAALLNAEQVTLEDAKPQDVQGVSTLAPHSTGFERFLKFVGSVAGCVALSGFFLWYFLASGSGGEDPADAVKKGEQNTSSRVIRNIGYSQIVPEEPEKPELPGLVKPEAEEPAAKEKPRIEVVLVNGKPVIQRLEKDPVTGEDVPVNPLTGERIAEPAVVETVPPQPVQTVRTEPARPEKEGPSILDLKRAAPMMGTGMPGTKPKAERPPEDLGNVRGDVGNGPVNKFRAMMNGSDLEKTTVTRMAKRHLTLEKGTFIDCILETRMDTTVPGMTACVIPQNVYSMDGRTLLIEKGSRALGEYTGSVANGLERIFVLWTEVRTPNGMIVKLDSPAADQMGGAGMGGYIDFHWWKRFGNALLFSMISDGFDFATAKANEGSNNSYYTNTSDNMNAIIEEAMKQAGNIPPTLYKNQGERIGIFVARDVDFSGVYELKKSR